MEKSPSIEATSADGAIDPSSKSNTPSFNQYGIVIGVMIASFLIAIDANIVATAIPSITADFHVNSDAVWYGAAYPLTMCALQPFSGKIATIFSLRWTYLSFFGIFLLGSVICGAATSSKMLIVGRAVAGVGGAGVSSGGMSVVVMVTPPERHPLFMSLVMSIYSLGTVVAPVLGGAFTEDVSWRWCFYVNLPLGAVTIAALLLFFKPPPRANQSTNSSLVEKLQQLDILGCILFIGAITMFLLALQWGGHDYAWNSPTIIGLFVGSALTTAVFVTWEIHKEDEAMIPTSLFDRRSTVFALLFAFLSLGALIIPVYYLPKWFQIVKGESPIHAGLMMLPCVVTQFIGGMIAGITAKRFRYYNPWFFLGAGLLCIAVGLYTTFTAHSTSAGKWIGFQVLQGFGCGFAAQMPVLMIQKILGKRANQIPQGIATVMLAHYFGSAVVQCIDGAIFQSRLIRQLTSRAGLDLNQVAMLFEAGDVKVWETTRGNFPDRLGAVLEAYNDAIAKAFFLAVASSAMALVVSLGIEWIDIREKPEDISEASDKDQSL